MADSFAWTLVAAAAGLLGCTERAPEPQIAAELDAGVVPSDMGDEIAQAQAKIKECGPRNCERFGTECLCASDRTDASCEFRTAKETRFVHANEEGGNECLAACILALECEDFTSENDAWRACRSGCDRFFEPVGCPNTPCQPGQACVRDTDHEVTGVCKVLESRVFYVEVDPTPYADGCAVHEDCRPVVSKWDCECGYPGCGRGAVLASNVDDFEELMEAAKATCTPDLFCINPGECFDEDTRAACVAGTCEPVKDTSVCVTDAECLRPSPQRVPQEFLDEDNVRCIALTHPTWDFALECAECMYEPDVVGFETTFDLPSCPAGTFCSATEGPTKHTCQPLQACSTNTDCAGVEIPNYGSLACRDGLCQPCEADVDCGATEVCVTNAPKHPAAGQSGVWGSGNGCWAASSDAECLESTCPRPCRQDGNVWVCI